jgi:hypothetical protein
MQRVNGDSLNFAERSRRKGRLWLQVANNVRECSREKLRPPKMAIAKLRSPTTLDYNLMLYRKFTAPP